MLIVLVGCGRISFEESDGGMDSGGVDSGGDDSGGDDSGGVDAGPNEPVLVDPFGDGTSFAVVFTHAGSVYLGPNRTGDRALRLLDGGERTESISFRFTRDADPSGGGVSENTSPAPYAGIGFSGCAVNTAACGPDNEDGRGFIQSGRWGGAEWLIIGGARSTGLLDYVYATDDTDSVLDFRYLDISENTGGRTHGLSALGFLGDRLYVGLPDTGARRPYLVSIDAPPAPGMDGRDTTQNGNMDAPCDSAVHDSCDLGATHFPGLGIAGGNLELTVLVDFIATLGNRLYLGNNGGLMRSASDTPLVEFRKFFVDKGFR